MKPKTILEQVDHITTYNINSDNRMLISLTANLTPAPAIIIQTPPLGEVGEGDLINDLLKLVYEKNVNAGLHRKDSIARHFAFRNLPYDGSAADYQSFTDELQKTNPFTDEFYGIDAIDMTAWAHKRFSGIGWNILKRHIRENTETDFVFLMKSGSGPASDLQHALQHECGIPIEKVVIEAPKPEMLATFVKKRIDLSDDHMIYLVEWIKRVASDDRMVINYSWANRLATKIAMERAFLDHPADFLLFLNESCRALDNSNKKLGF